MSLKLIHLWFLPPLMLAFAAGSLYALNIADKWQVHRMNSSARQMATPPAEIFNVEMIAELPAVAQRFFTFSIQPGAKLRTRVRLHMQGELGVGVTMTRRAISRSRPVKRSCPKKVLHGIAFKRLANGDRGQRCDVGRAVLDPVLALRVDACRTRRWHKRSFSGSRRALFD